MANEPSEVRFAKMPMNAITTDLVDVLCPLDEMPNGRLDYVRPVAADASTMPPTNCVGEFLALLRGQGALDFRGYHTRMLLRRRRLGWQPARSTRRRLLSCARSCRPGLAGCRMLTRISSLLPKS